MPISNPPQKADQSERLIERPASVDEAARVCNVSPRFLWDQIARGKLRARRLSPRLVRIAPKDLQAWWEASAS